MDGEGGRRECVEDTVGRGEGDEMMERRREDKRWRRGWGKREEKRGRRDEGKKGERRTKKWGKRAEKQETRRRECGKRAR